MAAATHVDAWQPAIAGIHEVLHARFTEHAYPSHTHEVWTLLIVDDGAITYGLDRAVHGAEGASVTLLPPDVPHDGRSARPGGFRKRVLYLDRSVLDDELIGRAVDEPGFTDPLLRQRIDQLHRRLAHRADTLESESRLGFIAERLLSRLRGPAKPTLDSAPAPSTAALLRDLIDARTPEPISLAEAAALLDASPSMLVRAFTRAYGIAPHLYLTGRRVDLARSHLLAGMPVANAAVAAGFYDQSHLTRHFKRMLGVSPTRFARAS